MNLNDYIEYMNVTAPNAEMLNAVAWTIAHRVEDRETFNVKEIMMQYGIFDDDLIDSAYDFAFKLFNEYNGESVSELHDTMYEFLAEESR